MLINVGGGFVLYFYREQALWANANSSFISILKNASIAIAITMPGKAIRSPIFEYNTKRLSVMNGIPLSDTILRMENRIGIFYILAVLKQKNGSRCLATLKY